MGTVNIDAIVARLHELEEENSRLKALLSKHGIIPYEEKRQNPIPVVSKSENKDSAMRRLSLQEKIDLFRTLFKGREDVMSDNTCNFLCTDFDDKSCEHGFQNDVLAFIGICKEWEIPCYIERSRSENGAHVWIFFEVPITAAKARKLEKAILSEAMNKDARLSFKSYDRFFPNQDTLPEGGFGNLVALPLQGKARRNGKRALKKCPRLKSLSCSHNN